MLNRRILRIKAFKILYAYAISGNMTLDEALAQLDASCEATRDLYLMMLSIIPPLAREAGARIEAARGKIHPSEEDLHPNEKFAANRLAALLADDPDFQKVLARKKLSWEPYDIFIRKTFDTIRLREDYQAYMAAPDCSLEQDCRLFYRIFEEVFVDSPDLEQILEDLSLWWIDDLAYSLTWCCRTLQDLSKGKAWRLPPLYQSEMVSRRDPSAAVESDRDFVRKLLRCALTGFDGYFDRITALVPGWDSDRLFSTDMALIAMGLAEAEHFPQIPLRVTINEYVEISKFYGTPKSRPFVNGLLDRIIQEMMASGDIAKTI